MAIPAPPQRPESASQDSDLASRPTRNDAAAPTGGWLDVAMRLALRGPSGPFALDVAFSVARGSLTAIIGPSGAGKTTLLRLLAGLAVPDAGRMRVGDAVWCDTAAGRALPTRHRSIGFVFQDYALFPHMTVRGNLDYALGRHAQPGEAQTLLRLVGLEALYDAYPARLSGGQKQRLALIRALARRPALLMLDEPLSALDDSMRRQMQDLLARLHRAFGTTTLLVSHDMAETLRLADRVIRLEAGQIVFDGSPATAFGLAQRPDAPRLMAEYVAGPDATGAALVRIDGRICRLRLRGLKAEPSPGDRVMLQVEDATAQALAPSSFRGAGEAREPGIHNDDGYGRA